jgi:hypothetical protein
MIPQHAIGEMADWLVGECLTDGTIVLGDYHTAGEVNDMVEGAVYSIALRMGWPESLAQQVANSAVAEWGWPEVPALPGEEIPY